MIFDSSSCGKIGLLRLKERIKKGSIEFRETVVSKDMYLYIYWIYYGMVRQPRSKWKPLKVEQFVVIIVK